MPDEWVVMPCLDEADTVAARARPDAVTTASGCRTLATGFLPGVMQTPRS